MQNTDDAKFIKNLTRWKGGSIEPHPSDKALIVNYQLEATVFGDPNNPMLGEKKLKIIVRDNNKFIFLSVFEMPEHLFFLQLKLSICSSTLGLMVFVMV
uniref:Uncharacterized protein n=1 Tax=Glossina palpalis gambiensis TaxID=67801 RepID=A0A1B0BHR6_9MUSC